MEYLLEKKPTLISILVRMLNIDQKRAYDAITCAVNGKGDKRIFFLYGYGGTGKTFVWRTLSAAMRCKGGIVLNCASSGIASLLLPGGRTAHSRFAIPLNPTDESMCNIKHGSDLDQLIEHANLIIWDEALMMHSNCFEFLDRSLRDIMRGKDPRNEDRPFGGKVVMFSGDFRQILPVIPKGTRPDIVHATINSSELWSDCEVLRLNKNMRLQRTDENDDVYEIRAFSEWLTEIGDGTLGGENDGEVDIEMPDDILITESDKHSFYG